MGYQVEFLPEAETDLAKLDSTVRERIFKKVKGLSENFEGVTPEALPANSKDISSFASGTIELFIL